MGSQEHRVERRLAAIFAVKKREARAGRNPRTGQSVSISENVVLVFRTGKEMRHRLNPAPQKRAKKRREADVTDMRGFVRV
jgi:integration host factor subunit beta